LSKDKTSFQNGDVLFAKITPCMENGKCAIARELINGIGFGSTEFHVIRARNKIIPEWVYYYLRQANLRKEAERNMTGSAGQRRVPTKFIEEVFIPLPPLDEQKRIAAILSKADRLRRLRRYAGELSDGYLQSVFLEMFGDPVSNPRGWERTSIGDVIASSQYGTSDKSNSEQRGYPILGMGNITYSGKIDLTTLAYVELSEDEFKTLRLEPGDIIFNRTNSTELVGKTAHWNYEFDAVLASYLVKLKLKQDILPDYFTSLLNTDYYKRLFQERCRKAVGQSNISPTLLKEFPVLIPPLPLQQKFTQIVQNYERLRAQQRESARQAEHLFQSLLHSAFRGEL
jgi:type I restriction enzyme S subunit